MRRMLHAHLPHTHGVWMRATVSPSSCGQCFSSESTMAEHSSAEVKVSCCCALLTSSNSKSRSFDCSMLCQTSRGGLHMPFHAPARPSSHAAGDQEGLDSCDVHVVASHCDMCYRKYYQCVIIPLVKLQRCKRFEKRRAPRLKTTTALFRTVLCNAGKPSALT
jgi:hypothetical protein